MRIASTQYNLNKRAFEIYFSGCNFHCKGCHNEELWDFYVGEEITDKKLIEIINKIIEHQSMINEIWILGGEPLHQTSFQFNNFCKILLNFSTDKKLVLFTGFNLDEIADEFPWCFDVFDEIKYGRYIEELRTEGEELASSNQNYWRK
jgi:anaerobic ribonucleoside-triphosphate reductase activating protein